MKKSAITFALLAVLALPGVASAAPCRNAQGHFIKCATPATAPAAPAARPAAARVAAPARPAVAHAAAPAAHRCRSAKGQFAKCGTPGAKPA